LTTLRVAGSIRPTMNPRSCVVNVVYEAQMCSAHSGLLIAFGGRAGVLRTT
jgi:hypothetical protein